MDRIESAVKRLWVPISQALDAFDYAVECTRGYLADPFFSLCHKSRELATALLRPRQSRRDYDIRASNRRKNRYALNMSKISFYDSFSSVAGIIAFPLNNANSQSVSEHQQYPHMAGTSKTKEQEMEYMISQTKERPSPFTAFFPSAHVRECAFSLDSSRLAVCYSNGEVIIWDTDHGTLVKKTTMGENEISAVSFHGESNSVLLICTQDNICWRWNADGDDVECTEFLNTEEASGISGEVYLQKSNFFINGKVLVLSSMANCERGCELSITVVDITSDPLEFQPQLHYPVSNEEKFVVSKIALSPDGRGILVGLIDEGMEDSFCVLWPNFKEESSLCHKLRIGTVGSWSLDSKYVVTWTMIGTSNLEDDNGSSAFIWNVEEIREQPRNPEYSLEPKYITITNPYKNQVVWCHIIADMDQKHRLIMGIAGESVRFLYWDLESKIHTHTIETKISAKDMILFNHEAWIRAYVEQTSVKGLSPLSVREDDLFFGAVLGWPSAISMWDVYSGVEVFKVSLRDLEDNHQFKGGIDLIGSPSGEKFAIIGNNGVMVFCPAIPSKCGNKTERLLKTQMVELENQTTSHKMSDYKLKFSGDGDTLGVQNYGLSKMLVCNLSLGRTCTIEVTALTENSIREFCLSNNGEHLAIYIEKNIQVWKSKSAVVYQPIAIINTEAEVVDIGIKDDASQIVVCNKDGSIFIYYAKSVQDNQYDDGESSASFAMPIREGDSGHRLRTLGSDLEQSFLNDSVLPHETPLESVEIDSLNKEYPLSKRHVLCGEAYNATFQVSPSFKRLVRIIDFEYVEIWDLETKYTVESGDITIASIRRSPEFFSRVSYVSQQVYEKLISSKEALFDGTSITLTEQTTVVQSAKEHVVVAADAPSSGGTQKANRTSYDIEFEEEKHEDSHSVYIINLNDAKLRRRLRGKDLDPSKGLAISEDGRHVACFAGKNASKVVVWNAHASEGLLPDYHFLKLNDAIRNREAIEKEIVPMIDYFGSQFFNFQHPSGMSILEEAIWYFNYDLLKTILKYVEKEDIKVSFVLSNTSNEWIPKSTYRNAIEASIFGKSPNTLKIIMKYFLRRVTYENEIINILGQSFTSVLQKYPEIYHRALTDSGMFTLMYEIEVPEDTFDGRQLITCTSNSLNLSSYETVQLWKQELNCENTESIVPTVRAMATTLLYSDACEMACDGLLHDLVVEGAHHLVFGSLVVRVVVEYKWRRYGQRLMFHEVMHHALLLTSYMLYCFMICTDGMYKIGARVGNEQNSNATRFSLIVCIVLAIPCLYRELRQCIIYTWHNGMCGFLCWATSAWNWMEIISYLNIIVVIPILEFILLKDGKKSILLSVLIGIECLLLWCRVLYYARMSRKLGKYVTVITTVVSAVIPFLLIAFCVMFGFAVSFHVLYRHVDTGSLSEKKDEAGDLDSLQQSFGTFGRTLFTVFGFIFGAFELEQIYKAPNVLAATVLFVLYMVIITTTFLNMLIAIMGQKFEGIRHDEGDRFLKAKAMVIDDNESMMSCKRKKELSGGNGKYLHIIMPSTDVDRIIGESSQNSMKPQDEMNTIFKNNSHRKLNRSQIKESSPSRRLAGTSLERRATPKVTSGQLIDILESNEEDHWYDSDSTMSNFEKNFDEEDD